MGDLLFYYSSFIVLLPLFVLGGFLVFRKFKRNGALLYAVIVLVAYSLAAERIQSFFQYKSVLFWMPIMFVPLLVLGGFPVHRKFRFKGTLLYAAMIILASAVLFFRASYDFQFTDDYQYFYVSYESGLCEKGTIRKTSRPFDVIHETGACEAAGGVEISHTNGHIYIDYTGYVPMGGYKVDPETGETLPLLDIPSIVPRR